MPTSIFQLNSNNAQSTQPFIIPLVGTRPTRELRYLTIEELLHGSTVKMPPQFGTFKQTQRVPQPEALQDELDYLSVRLERANCKYKWTGIWLESLKTR